MNYGNVHQSPDLTALFGNLTEEQSERLRYKLVALDERLDRLALEASEHVGVSYSNTGLGVFGANIAGGPSGDAGDIWFELDPAFDERSRSYRAPPWEMWARIAVFCDRELRGETRGYSCTHDLVSLRGIADTPAEALSLFGDHIERLAAEVKKQHPKQFLGAPHEELPAG